MFPGVSCHSLIREEVYLGGLLECTYFDIKGYLLKVLDFHVVDPRQRALSVDTRRESIWWAINEGWESYVVADCYLPLQWVSLLAVLIEKKALPRNVFHFGRCVISGLDVERYFKNQPMIAEDRQVFEKDYLYVIEALDAYDESLLLPDVAEDQWGSSDQ
jgi:hypothetical protein